MKNGQPVAEDLLPRACRSVHRDTECAVGNLGNRGENPGPPGIFEKGFLGGGGKEF